jgi:hypothetical protein
MIRYDGFVEVTAVYRCIAWPGLGVDQVADQVQAGKRLSLSLAAHHSFHALTHYDGLWNAATARFLLHPATQCVWQLERHCRHIQTVIPTVTARNT